ncbi:MAG: 2-oxoglutarate dehydrogenase E1 component [Verrucomicrobiales bacterium]|nr:2-oxoglutarate dehydrogenase E1 component [Verrucomicrobiales bacterium]
MSSAISARLNVDLLDEKYRQWKQDARSVEPAWNAFFEGFELGSQQVRAVGPAQDASRGALPQEAGKSGLAFQANVVRLIEGYRSLGHVAAWLDPLSQRPEPPAELRLERFGLEPGHLDMEVATPFFADGRTMPVGRMLEDLQRLYCGWIGFEFMHISSFEVREWLRERIENRMDAPAPSMAQREDVLRALMEAAYFERFLHAKYVGQKRFSLEGSESVMVALQSVLEDCPKHGVEEIIMGMAHRGRLTVLENFLRKPLKVLLNEFSENFVPDLVAGDGDVKYHLGYENKISLADGKTVTVFLAPNPSHLEAVNPVVEGNARARQRLIGDTVERRRVLPLLLHGDAAFAGQGMVAETLHLSQLPGYRTGGTIHVIINNQIGFTTNPADARSSRYCTDAAKMIDAPVFHVNGDQPLEVWHVAKLALEFRQKFGRDVILDIVCYRRHGHNEGDEPSFTQPDMMKAIRAQVPVDKSFAEAETAAGTLTKEAVTRISASVQNRLDREHAELQALQKRGTGSMRTVFEGSTAVFQPEYSHAPVATGLPEERLRELGRNITEIPAGFHLHPKVKQNVVDKRRAVSEAGGPFDWGHAEHLAFASLLTENIPVRLSGQDVRRGTFSHRHCVFFDSETRESYSPLQHLSPDQARFCVYNSLLSENAVLGFDYGYSLMSPQMLICWEAQFGDFGNGAQVIIDQFLSSAESKWQKPSGLVMLLPHGYEGQGPEHSSARIERFLQLCAECNLQVCNLTTPAQYFHVLRRQVMRPFRKPLIIATPKSLLRDKRAVSSEADLAADTCFREMLDDPALPGPPRRIQRLIFCSGKIYYDLEACRQAHSIKNTAIIRIEQIYPWHEELLAEIIARYPARNKKFVWCQEEPLNMGPWSFVWPRLEKIADTKVRYAGRDRSASPAVGSKTMHDKEQAAVVARAFEV